MNLLDVNILIYAFRKDVDRHQEYKGWLHHMINGDSAFGVSEQALASLIRITTHPRIFQQPSTRGEAVEFAEALRRHPLCRDIRPSRSHWPLFLELCERADIKGNLITDAWFAALTIESGCVWITSDRDFARFPGLMWKHPLDHVAVIENPSAS